MKNKHVTKRRNTKTAKRAANARRIIMVKWLGASLLLGVAIILGVSGYFAYSGGAMLLVFLAFARQLVRLSLRCWEERFTIAELTLEIGAALMRILRRH